MKIAIRGGHSLNLRGASGLIDEVTEDRKVKDIIVKYLKMDGHEVLDVTPTNSNSSAQDLSFGVSKANAWGADYFCSIHFNAGGGRGTEVLYYNGSSKGKSKAEKIASKIAELGFINRGAKVDTRGLYELRNTKMPANIIEVCFVDNQSDVNLYRQLGIEKIGKAIAEGIIGHEIKEMTEGKIETKDNNDKSKYYTLGFQKFYNEITKTKAPIAEDSFWGAETEKAYETLGKLMRGEY